MTTSQRGARLTGGPPAGAAPDGNVFRYCGTAPSMSRGFIIGERDCELLGDNVGITPKFQGITHPVAHNGPCGPVPHAPSESGLQIHESRDDPGAARNYTGTRNAAAIFRERRRENGLAELFSVTSELSQNVSTKAPEIFSLARLTNKQACDGPRARPPRAGRRGGARSPRRPGSADQLHTDRYFAGSPVQRNRDSRLSALGCRAP